LSAKLIAEEFGYFNTLTDVNITAANKSPVAPASE